MKLSIITPTKNAGETIQRLIDSINRQDKEHHEIEHIIVDSLSTDSTEQIARESGAVFISQESTIYQAQNIGISIATGDFIYVIGADDELVDGAVAKMLSFQDEMVIVGLALHGNKKPVVSKYQQTTVYSKEIFKRHGNFDISHHVYADLWFIKKVYDSGVNIRFIDYPFAKIAPGGYSSRERDSMPGNIGFLTARINRKWPM